MSLATVSAGALERFRENDVVVLDAQPFASYHGMTSQQGDRPTWRKCIFSMELSSCLMTC
jgi:hypothetical protein